MKISFNPSNSNKNILDLIKNNKDIIFDLKGHNIFARGVKFCGTDTWRDIKINNVSIGSNTLNLRNGSNTTLTNTNGVVTINSTWRPVVDNLTSDSTTSSLSAKQGKVLKSLIDGKSNSGHTHDDRYLKLTGGTMASNALITFADSGSWGTDKGPQGARGGLYWTGQSDYAKLYAEETAGDNLDLVIQFGDDNSNGLSIRNKANTQTSYISASGVITTGTFKGNLDWSYITNKPSSYTPSAHTHAWNSLTHSSTTENQAILTNGKANGWKLYTLNIARWDNAANNAHSHSNKSVLDGITSALVNNWNIAYNFVNTITGADTDKVINKWDEIVNFLAGITEDNKLNTLLNSKLSVYELANNTNVGAIKNNGIYYSTTDASSGTLTNSPFNTGFALINMTSYDGGDDLRRSRLAFNAYGEIKVSDDRDLANTAETWYNVLTSKNSGINGSTIKLNGTSITVYSSSTADGRYVKKSGDTMSGVLTIDTTNFGALTIKRNDDANGASIQFRGKSSVYGYIGLNNSTKDKLFLRWSSDTSKTYTILDTSSTYVSSGKGIINGTTITLVSNADTVDGYHANGGSPTPYGRIPVIESDGVMEVGKYIDFHNDNSGEYDYSTRLQTAGNYRNIVYLPSAGGTIALTKNIPTSLPANGGNADTVDGYHASGLLTALSNSNRGISLTVGGTTKSLSNISVGDADTVDGVHANQLYRIYTFNVHNSIIKVGTLTSGQSGHVCKLRFNSGIGYNAGNQDKTMTVVIRASNGSANSNGFYFEAHSESYRGGAFTTFYLHLTSKTQCELYMAAFSYSGQSTYEISFSNGDSWTNEISVQDALPTSNIFTLPNYQIAYTDYNVASATKLATARSIWGQSFDGTRDVSGTLSGVAHILFSADNTYNIGSNSAASKYIYTYWLGAKSGLKLELGANNSNFGLGLCIDTNLNVGIGTNTPAYKLHVNGTFRATNSTVSNLFVNTGDATLKIYSGRTTDAVDDGHIGLLTSIDSTDGETHTHPTNYGSRCVLALLPRGGSVYIGNMPNGGNGRKLNVNGDIGLFNVGSIRDLTIGGGIYWNPYVESTTDSSDAASITVVRLGVAGGTTLVLSLMNDANDTILFKTSTAARLYHNSYPILTTLNTYVSNNKGYINGTEITLVNNSDTIDGWHKDNILWTGYITSPDSLSSYWFKMYDITVTGYLYNDITITFLISEGYSAHFSIFYLKIRLNGTGNGNYALDVTLRELVGNLQNKIVAYYNNSTGNVLLWGNTGGRWNTMNYTILKKTTRTATDLSSLGTLTAQGFSSVQTPPSTGYTKLTMARVGSVSYSDSTGSVHWNNVTNKPSTFSPAAHTHTVFKNNLMIKGTNGVSDSASIHLGIGDSDTGFKWISDGRCLIYANNSAVGEWTSGGMNWFKNPTVNGNKVWNAGNDGSGSGLDADLLDGWHLDSIRKNVGYSWSAKYRINNWSRIIKIDNYSNILLAIEFSQMNQASNHLYLISTGYGCGNIVQLGANGYSSNSVIKIRLTENTATSHNVEIYSTYGYNGATELSINCNYTRIDGNSTITTYLTYTAGGGTVRKEITSSYSKIVANLQGNSDTTTKLQTPRQINGTNFDGTSNITTSYWGATRTISLTGAVTGSVSTNGSGNITINTTYGTGNITNLDNRYVKKVGDMPTNAYDLIITPTGLGKEHVIDPGGGIHVKAHTGTPFQLWLHDTSNVWYKKTSNGAWTKMDAGHADIASAATKLQTSRSIWGHSFNGTADVNGTIYINNSNSSEGAIRLNNNINSNARISAIDSQVIFNTGAAIRFGGISWDWNVWAGLKYDHTAKTIYLGLADNSIFNANSALSGGSLRFPGISNVYATTFNGSLSGNASSASKWLTARTFTIGNTSKSVDGSSNVSWSLSEIGAASSSHSHNYAANENYGGFTKSERLPISGFYQSCESESGGNAPWSSWMHLINCLHSNTGNNYALLIAASFFDNNTFKIRVTNNNVNNAWRDIIHSGNIGSLLVKGAYMTPLTLNIEKLISSGYLANDYTNRHNTEEYMKAAAKYLLKNYPGYSVFGTMVPNAMGFFTANIYDSGFNSNGNPEHITIHYYPHGGDIINCGTTYGSWYYSSINRDGSSYKLQTARKIWGQSFDGTADISGNMSSVGLITFSALSGTNGRALLYLQMADNDYFRIYAGGTASNSGYVEIATADDGNEPIYVRQYTGVFSAVKRTLTLLDANGYTHFPSYINIGGNENNNSSPDRVWGSNGSDSYLRSYRTSALNVNYAASAGNADTVDGYHASAFAAASHTHPYLPLSGAYITGTNIADMKVNIRNYFNGKPAGTNCYVGSPNIIYNFLNDSAACDANSVCGIMALNPGYDNYNHGHFLVSHYGDNRIGMIGLGYLTWYGPNWFAYTSDIPTVTDYYWANIKVSASSSTSTSPTFESLWINNSHFFKLSGTTFTCQGGTTFTLPSSNINTSTALLWTTASDGTRDTGIFYNSSDFAFIANSNDHGAVFAVYDTDVTQDFEAGAREISVPGSGGALWARGGFSKSGSSNDYVLLGGGGHKPLSEFSTNTDNVADTIKIWEHESNDAWYYVTWTTLNGTGYGSIYESTANLLYNPSLKTLWTGGGLWASLYVKAASIRLENTNEINSYSGDLYLNHRNTASGSEGHTANIKMCGTGGNVIIGANDVPSYLLDVRGSVIASSWLRTRGNSGWYSESYGGGIYMIDTSWIRTYNGKGFYCDNLIYSSNSIRMGNILLEHTDEINNSANGGLHLNYRNTGNVTLCNGGGAVTIGTTSTDIGGNKLFVNGSEFIDGASNVRNHVFADGFRHRSHNSNDSVLLAGGGYSQGVPVKYWSIEHIIIDSPTDAIKITRGGNYTFITKIEPRIKGSCTLTLQFPSGYSEDNTIIWAIGNLNDEASNSSNSSIYATIIHFLGSKYYLNLADDSTLNNGSCQLYFMCF